MCEGSICAGDFDAALTYDLCSAEDRERRCEVDIRVRNWWLTRSMKDCSSCLGGGDDNIVMIVCAALKCGSERLYGCLLMLIVSFVRSVYTHQPRS